MKMEMEMEVETETAGRGDCGKERDDGMRGCKLKME